MHKEQVTDILEEIAVLLELSGENPFKALAYTKARARSTATSEIWNRLSRRRSSDRNSASAMRCSRKSPSW